MEPKPSPSTSPSAQPAAQPPPRRRGAAAKTKRKAAAAASSSSPSPPPKRQTRERNPFDLPPLPPPQTGLLSRAARRSPLKPTPVSATPPKEEVEPRRAREATRLPPMSKEFDAVRSRGAGVHVVPTFSGWFSWKQIHPVEKQALASFFNGKSERRTPEMYFHIRNFIMKKFHSNPQVHLESKDLLELSNGELDAQLEVLEFLSHWGLVNFHPFLPAGKEGGQLFENKSNADTGDETCLIKKLFQFEAVQSYLVPVANKPEVTAPAQIPSLLSEPTIAEDLITAAESSVEYHCNSCSVDCSRKRYHCRTQADFDLCCDCYNEGKFDAGMSQTDFIIMESAEVHGSGGTCWTDQETLLLLEALEIFKAKWDDIAEHVATKSKAQCMLHFLQMPIVESFLDGPDNQSYKGTEEVLAERNTLGVPDKIEVDDKVGAIETTAEKTFEKRNVDCAETETCLADNDVIGNKDTNIPGDINAGESDKSSDPDPAKKETATDIDTLGRKISNDVIDVLKSALEAVGDIADKEDLGSFAEAGNPVMALAAFLAGLVDHDNAIFSCCNSLRAITERSPALQLAARHCFILQDPPSELNHTPVSVSSSNKGDEQQDEDMTSNPDNTGKGTDKEKEKAALSMKHNTTSILLKDFQEPNRKESSDEVLQVESESNSSKYSQVKGGGSDNMRKGCNFTSHPVTLNDTDEPFIDSQESGEGNTKETTLVHVEEVRPNSSSKIEHAVTDLSTVQHVSNQTSLETSNIEGNDSFQRLQRAAATTISAAAVKSKVLADQEEDQIQRLAAFVIEKQFQKMEVKMSTYTEIENWFLAVSEFTDRTRKKLLMERRAILAGRMAAMQYRPNQPVNPGIRLPVGDGMNQQLRRP